MRRRTEKNTHTGTQEIGAEGVAAIGIETIGVLDHVPLSTVVRYGGKLKCAACRACGSSEGVQN